MGNIRTRVAFYVVLCIISEIGYTVDARGGGGGGPGGGWGGGWSVPKMTVQLASDPYNGEVMYKACPSNFAYDLTKLDPVRGGVAIANDYKACSSQFFNPGEMRGKIVIVGRSDCEFIYKASNLEINGAIGGIVIDDTPGSTIETDSLTMGADSGSVNIPFVFLYDVEGSALLDAYNNDTSLEVVLTYQPVIIETATDQTTNVQPSTVVTTISTDVASEITTDTGSTELISSSSASTESTSMTSTSQSTEAGKTENDSLSPTTVGGSTSVTSTKAETASTGTGKTESDSPSPTTVGGSTSVNSTKAETASTDTTLMETIGKASTLGTEEQTTESQTTEEAGSTRESSADTSTTKPTTTSLTKRGLKNDYIGIIKELLVEKAATNRNYRKFNTADDPRPSCTAIGMGFLIPIVFVYACIIIADLPKLIGDFLGKHLTLSGNKIASTT